MGFAEVFTEKREHALSSAVFQSLSASRAINSLSVHGLTVPFTVLYEAPITRIGLPRTGVRNLQELVVLKSHLLRSVVRLRSVL